MRLLAVSEGAPVERGSGLVMPRLPRARPDVLAAAKAGLDLWLQP